METLTRPPARPLKTLAMENCIGCHEQSKYVNGEGAGVMKTGTRHVSTDCTSCHH
jgi:phage tail sheath gpL-like